MATAPTTFTEAGRRSSSSSRRATHGRGGAGNMGPATIDVGVEDLETPTIKSDVYTTGRGGSGNMAKNTDPWEARRAQDVSPPPSRESDSKTHVGRGGAANVFRPSSEDMETAKHGNERWENAIRDEPPRAKTDKGLAEKGREWLFGKRR